MNFEFLAQADATTLRLEKAKRMLDLAKAELEASKQAYDELLSRADENGIAKAKLKKLTEERVAALFEAGMIDLGTSEPVVAAVAKPEKPRKAKKKEVESEAAPWVDEPGAPTDESYEAAEPSGFA